MQPPTILSMPRGPKLVRTASATAFAACMLLMRTSFFLAFSLRDKAVSAGIDSHALPAQDSNIHTGITLAINTDMHSVQRRHGISTTRIELIKMVPLSHLYVSPVLPPDALAIWPDKKTAHAAPGLDGLSQQAQSVVDKADGLRY